MNTATTTTERGYKTISIRNGLSRVDPSRGGFGRTQTAHLPSQFLPVSQC